MKATVLSRDSELLRQSFSLFERISVVTTSLNYFFSHERNDETNMNRVGGSPTTTKSNFFSPSFSINFRELIDAPLASTLTTVRPD